MIELPANRRILVIDDNPAIHEDFRKVLGGRYRGRDDLGWIERDVLGGNPDLADDWVFEVDSALRGEEGAGKVREAAATHKPYAVAFVDIRMPSGWDGIETIEHLWEADPNLQVVICSAYADYSWDDIRRRLRQSHGLLILKKPFDNAELTQMAHALTRKWALQEAEQHRLEKLEAVVKARTGEIEEANRRLTDEMAQRQKMEAELRLAQKLEAIGQLAAGIAHEINTPVQYVSDNVHFLRSSFAGLESLRAKLRDACGFLARGNGSSELLGEIEELEEEIDVEYLAERIPKAFDSALDGLGQIARIVHAMKEFGHQGSSDKSAVDLNRALLTTLEVARNEYKYVADVETELGDLPAVTCLGGEMNQVFLNLIVNAAHAIGDVAARSGSKGKMRIRTQVDGGDAVITIGDTGAGIPEEIRGRIFDPFFTTKEVGRGTGQGLAIARSVVVDKHGGSLTFESRIGQGTTFMIRIPVQGDDGCEKVA
jgi:signal transduction histidine kinase